MSGIRGWGLASRLALAGVVAASGFAAVSAVAAWRIDPLPRGRAPVNVQQYAADVREPRTAAPFSVVFSAVARDPFRSDRQRPLNRYRLPGERAPTEQVAGNLRPTYTGIELVGTTVSGDGGMAVLQMPRRPPRLVHVGDSIEGLELVSVERRIATLAGSDTTLILELSGPPRALESSYTPVEVATPVVTETKPPRNGTAEDLSYSGVQADLPQSNTSTVALRDERSEVLSQDEQREEVFPDSATETPRTALLDRLQPDDPGVLQPPHQRTGLGQDTSGMVRAVSLVGASEPAEKDLVAGVMVTLPSNKVGAIARHKVVRRSRDVSNSPDASLRAVPRGKVVNRRSKVQPVGKQINTLGKRIRRAKDGVISTRVEAKVVTMSTAALSEHDPQRDSLGVSEVDAGVPRERSRSSPNGKLRPDGKPPDTVDGKNRSEKRGATSPNSPDTAVVRASFSAPTGTRVRSGLETTRQNTSSSAPVIDSVDHQLPRDQDTRVSVSSMSRLSGSLQRLPRQDVPAPSLPATGDVRDDGMFLGGHSCGVTECCSSSVGRMDTIDRADDGLTTTGRVQTVSGATPRGDLWS